jgi:predicted phosphate transport protein (TIGR00153 family)
MPHMLFGRSKELEIKITEYLDLVNRGSLTFKRDLNRYIKKNFALFEESLNDIKEIENDADEHQKDIKYKLYKYMLIPESRADVLTIIEEIDTITDLAKEVIFEISIEQPNIPDELENDFLELVENSTEAVDMLVKSIRAFFEEISQVNDYVNKVHFFEHQADKNEERLKRKIFSDQFEKIDIAHKIQLRYFIEEIAALSDQAETVSEDVSVAAIKRRI